MSDQPQRRGVIGFATALGLYCALIAGAVFVLKGNARIVLILIIILLAVKTWVDWQRRKLE